MALPQRSGRVIWVLVLLAIVFDALYLNGLLWKPVVAPETQIGIQVALVMGYFWGRTSA